MVDYNRAKATAIRLLGENGRDVTIIAKGANTGTDYNPVYGPDIETPAIAVITKFSTAEIDGTVIKKQDKKMLIDADYIQTAITAGGELKAQTIKDDTTVYSIVDFEELKPGPLAILYKIQLRV